MKSADVADNFRVADVFGLLEDSEWQVAAPGAGPVPACPPRALDASGRRTELGRELVSLYEAHAGILGRYARTIVPGAQTASDAVQETFLRYLIARRNGKSIESPKAWLFRVLHNLLLDWRKQAGATAETNMDAAARTFDERPDPEAACRQAEQLRRFEVRLSPRELDCLRLRLAGLQHREIAEVMGITTGTVGSLLARVLKKTEPRP